MSIIHDALKKAQNKIKPTERPEERNIYKKLRQKKSLYSNSDNAPLTDQKNDDIDLTVTAIEKKKKWNITFISLIAIFSLGVGHLQASLEPAPVHIRVQSPLRVRVGVPFTMTVILEPGIGEDTDPREAEQGSLRFILAGPLARLDGNEPVLAFRVDAGVSRQDIVLIARDERDQEMRIEYVEGDAVRSSLRLFLTWKDGVGDLETLGARLARQALYRIDSGAGAGLQIHRLEHRPRIQPPGHEPRTGETAILSGRFLHTSAQGNLEGAQRISISIHPSPAVGSEDQEDQTSSPIESATQYTDPEGRFRIPLGEDTPPSFILRFSLQTPRWIIGRSSRSTYAWDSTPIAQDPSDRDVGDFIVPADQVVTEAIWIHVTLNKAQSLFESIQDDLSWWPAIPIRWPASGDYFSWGTVNVTSAKQWDVVGHEFGHAIFHFGTSAVSSGGRHKIDECYESTLAWSEGWASYFSAVAQVDGNDPDAKFEYMVPRRAPIRFENVPEDVCAGPKNEWRVTAALWDVYDIHDDGNDRISVSFDTMWKAMRDGNRQSALKDYTDFLSIRLNDEERNLLQPALEQNLNP